MPTIAPADRSSRKVTLKGKLRKMDVYLYICLNLTTFPDTFCSLLYFKTDVVLHLCFIWDMMYFRAGV